MNIEALNRGYKDNFERTSAYDFFVFYPNYVLHYDYERLLDGHIVDIDSSIPLTHSVIRRFVREVMNNSSLYNSLFAAYSNQKPSDTVYDFESRKLVVRHLRGDWSTVSSVSELNVYFNNPLFGTTTTDLAHNFYMAWVGGYQRNRVYYGDLIVPVARSRFGPTIRNESILPIHIVRGLTFPNRINATGLLLEDWLEYRQEYDSDEWSDSSTDIDDIGTFDADGYFIIPAEDDSGKYRLIYTDPESGEQVVYFEFTADEDGLISITPIPEGAQESATIQQYLPCTAVDDYESY